MTEDLAEKYMTESVGWCLELPEKKKIKKPLKWWEKIFWKD